MIKHLISALAVVALLGLAYVFLSPAPTAVEEGPTWAPPAITGLDGIRIEYPERHIDLRRGADGWQIREPIEFAAASRQMERVEGLFADADDPLLVLDERPADAASLTRHGFADNPSTIRVTLFEGDAEALVLVVGGSDESASGATRTWVRGGPNDALYRLNADLRGVLDKPLDDWRDRRVVSVAADERDGLVRIEMQHDGSTFALVRDPTPEGHEAPSTWSVDGAGERRFDAEAVNRAARRVFTLSVDGFADEQTPESAGIQTPSHTAALIFADGESIRVAFGDPIADDDGEPIARYVQRDGGPIVRVREAAAANFMLRIEDFVAEEPEGTGAAAADDE